jgi:type IV secretion system protein VirB3
MAGELRRDTLFVALTRPQMFAGVTWSFFVINAVIAVELFLIFRSLWVLLAALLIHG